MSRVKTLWMEQEPIQDESLNELIRELQAFSKEFSEDNDLAEERERERARQFVSLWKI
jgi:hypothetical protein